MGIVSGRDLFCSSAIDFPVSEKGYVPDGEEPTTYDAPMYGEWDARWNARIKQGYL